VTEKNGDLKGAGEQQKVMLLILIGLLLGNLRLEENRKRVRSGR
jgi:hypothetical protein